MRGNPLKSLSSASLSLKESTKDKEMQLIINSLPFTYNGYVFSKVIGTGSFGVVFLVRHNGYQREFAAKMVAMNRQSIRLTESANQSNLSSESEFLTLMRLNHPNIIKIYDNFTYKNQFVMVLQYCSNGTLKNLIQPGVGIPKEDQLPYVKQLLSALAFSHERFIAHRDLKTTNVFIDSFDRPLLADFGLSQMMKSEDGELSSFCGSLIYRSPEMVLQHPHDPFKADVWALGIIFYIMVTGNAPWSNFSMKEEIVNGKITIPDTVNPEISQLISRMLTVDPNKRPSIQNLVMSTNLNFDTVKKVDAGHRTGRLTNHCSIPRCLVIKPTRTLGNVRVTQF